MNNKVYALKVRYTDDCDWDIEDIECIGVFSTKELVAKAANDFLKKEFEKIPFDEEKYYKIPKEPLIFDQLLGYSGYEYYYFSDYHNSRIFIAEYELDELYEKWW